MTDNEKQKRLKLLFNYNQETGDFTRLVSPCNFVKIGDVSGYLRLDGYLYIGIFGKQYLAHRLAFLYMTGEMPEFCDHINQVKNDNRWCNLRPATKSQNNANSKMQTNNTSGYRGVSWHKPTGKWYANIKTNGKQQHLGSFNCKHHAFCEYVLASRRLFREFSPV